VPYAAFDVEPIDVDYLPANQFVSFWDVLFRADVKWHLSVEKEGVRISRRLFGVWLVAFVMVSVMLKHIS